MENLRLFIACDFSPQTIAKVALLAKDLRLALQDVPVRWVSSSNYHLTLQFLGEVPANKVKTIESALQAVAATHSSFAIELAGAGCFPSLRQPQVIWLGIRLNPQLNRLAYDLHRWLGALGFVDDSKFKAHLTLGRLDKYAAEDEKARLGTQVGAIKDVTIGQDVFSEIALYRSVLTPAGPVYTTLVRAKLQNMLN